MKTVLTVKTVPCSNILYVLRTWARGLLQNKYSFKYRLNKCVFFLYPSFLSLFQYRLVSFLLAFYIFPSVFILFYRLF
jgi:hypothetical protein